MIEKWKSKTKRPAIVWISIVLAILMAGVVYGIDTISEGFRINTGTTGTVDLSSHTGVCKECKKVTNATGKDIFVGTKSCAEWDSFKANLPAGVTISNCFVCGNTFTDTRDGAVYNTVQIGTQCWMKENIRYGTRILGEKSDGNYDQANNSLAEKYCWNDLDANCATYGGYYQWHEAMQLPLSCDTTDCSASVTYPHQGICPEGWHVPSDVEDTGNPSFNNDWSTLENYLKTVGQSCAPNRSPNNEDIWACSDAGTDVKAGGSSGLNLGLVGSLCNDTGCQQGGNSWIDMGVDGHYWTSGGTTNSVDSNKRTWARDFEPSKAGIKRRAKEKERGFPVRCIKD